MLTNNDRINVSVNARLTGNVSHTKHARECFYHVSGERLIPVAPDKKATLKRWMQADDQQDNADSDFTMGMG